MKPRQTHYKEMYVPFPRIHHHYIIAGFHGIYEVHTVSVVFEVSMHGVLRCLQCLRFIYLGAYSVRGTGVVCCDVML